MYAFRQHEGWTRMYGGVFVCVTTLNRGTEDKANKSLRSTLSLRNRQSSEGFLALLFGRWLQVLSDVRRCRRRLTLAWTTKDSKLGPETNQRIVLGPRMRSAYVANRCCNKVLSQSSRRRATSALVEKLVHDCIDHAACCPAPVDLLAALTPIPTLATRCLLTGLSCVCLSIVSSREQL